MCVCGERYRKISAISEYGNNGNGKIDFISDNESNGKIYDKIIVGTSKGTTNRSGKKIGIGGSRNRNKGGEIVSISKSALEGKL